LKVILKQHCLPCLAYLAGVSVRVFDLVLSSNTDVLYAILDDGNNTGKMRKRKIMKNVGSHIY
jgi:hypothetical protein